MWATALLPSIVSVVIGSSCAQLEAGGNKQPVLGRRPDGLRFHVDGVARALVEAHRAAGAQGEIDGVLLALAELGDCLLGAGGEAVVALEAVTAGQAPFGLVAGLPRVDACHDLDESPAQLQRQLARPRPPGVEEQRQGEPVESN